MKVCASQSSRDMCQAAKNFKVVPPRRNAASSPKPYHKSNNTTTTANMADGIDRKAEERMEFTTSAEVDVAPTFTSSF